MYQDIVGLLQPTIITLRICGVCPSALRKVHIPLINVVYACLLAVPITYSVFSTSLYFYLVLNDITCFYGILGKIVDAISDLVILLFSFVMSSELVRFLKVMESVQRSLFSLNIRQPIHPTRITQIGWLVFLFFPMMYNTVLNILFKEKSSVFLAKTSVAVIRIGTVCKIRCLMDLVNHKLGLVNWHLNHFNHYWPPFLPRYQSQDHSYKDLSYEEDLRRSKFVLSGSDTGVLTPEKVRGFNKAHLKLHYAFRKLNLIFSIPLLAMYVSSGLKISFNIYFICNRQEDLKGHVLLPAVIEDIVAIILISSLTSITEKNFRKTAQLVHNLLDDESHPQDVVKELENFSKILLHRRTSLSAAGFFNVNLKIVTRMASLFAPIILFLIQNDNRPRAARNKPK